MLDVHAAPTLASRAAAGVRSTFSKRDTTSLSAAVVTQPLYCQLAASPQSIPAFLCGRHILLAPALLSLPRSLHQDTAEGADLCRTVQAPAVNSTASGWCFWAASTLWQAALTAFLVRHCCATLQVHTARRVAMPDHLEMLDIGSFRLLAGSKDEQVVAAALRVSPPQLRPLVVQLKA